MYDKNKYVLHKVVEGPFETNELVDPSTYFVLRKGDILGTATLWSYVHNIRSLLEVNEFASGAVLRDEQTAYLSELANDISFMAAEWEREEGKIPD